MSVDQSPIPFRWHTHDGRALSVTSMGTTHLLNSLVMVWNHTAPEPLRFKPYRPWRLDLRPGRATYWRVAVVYLARELSGREDMTDVQKERFADLVNRAAAYFGDTFGLVMSGDIEPHEVVPVGWQQVGEEMVGEWPPHEDI